MFRALLLFPPGTTKVTMEAPIAVTLVDQPDAKPVELDVKPEAIFTTAVGHSSKRTLASWHVTTPQEIVDHMLELVKDVPYVRTPSPRASNEIVQEEKANL